MACSAVRGSFNLGFWEWGRWSFGCVVVVRFGLSACGGFGVEACRPASVLVFGSLDVFV